ncbi:MAG TPA: Dabb family protein [Niastella sp.]|nr:Dabb family protein [Niastella sp.]
MKVLSMNTYHVKRSIGKTTAVALCMLVLYACNHNVTSAAKQKSVSLDSPADSLIQRIVCFKFKAGTSPEAIQKHMRGFANLKDSISYILSYQAGPTVKGDLTEKPEYDVMHYCTYRNEEEIKLYSVHPVHLRFIEQNKSIWEKVLVINSRVRP